MSSAAAAVGDDRPPICLIRGRCEFVGAWAWGEEPLILNGAVDPFDTWKHPIRVDDSAYRTRTHWVRFYVDAQDGDKGKD